MNHVRATQIKDHTQTMGLIEQAEKQKKSLVKNNNKADLLSLIINRALNCFKDLTSSAQQCLLCLQSESFQYYREMKNRTVFEKISSISSKIKPSLFLDFAMCTMSFSVPFTRASFR